MSAVVLGAWNVFADSGPVVALARAAACSGQGAGCVARQDGAYAKTPFFHDISLRTSHRRKVDVRCRRAYVFLGDYACAIKTQ
ncbi:MAG TPA: hypothetical protein VFH68_05880 [Polyangia bacterium]|nr:hypothetical protein [Polyangia bacterium]